VYYYIIWNQKIIDEFEYMKFNEEMIDAIGEVIPQQSQCSAVSLKESDGYMLIDCVCASEMYIKTPMQVVSESIRWGSRMMKSHPLYWADKRKLLARILRSANIALFTQCKDHIDTNAVHAMVGFRGNTHLWLGIVGQIHVWKYISPYMKPVYPQDMNGFVDPLGTHRYGFVPQIVSVPFEEKTWTIVSSGSVSGYLQTSKEVVFNTLDDVVSKFRTIEMPGAWIIIPHLTK
jgi:hypothetical protein